MAQEKNDLTLQTERLVLRVLDQQAAGKVADYYRRNRLFHDPWFPVRDEQSFTAQQQALNLAEEHKAYLAGRAIPFWLFLTDDPDRIIGRLAITQIVYGSLRSAFLAWHLDQSCQGRGLAFEAGQACVKRLFADLRLHRLEAVIRPGNRRSIALARRLGFDLEGLCPRYLKINGVWSDHLRFVRLSDGPLWPKTANQEDVPHRLLAELTHYMTGQAQADQAESSGHRN